MQSSERRLKTAVGAETQTGLNDFVVRRRRSLANLSIGTDDVSAYLYVPPGSHSYVDYDRERKNLLKMAFVKEKVEIPPSYVFICYRYV